ncbi:zinc metalloproteinase nas-6-like [Ptychodera flava]|uniref:zinc metalloproteinase nas-6-like n=1 Tax=Ptychodera flava TaxID=63121 RepID=UPI00396A49CB
MRFIFKASHKVRRSDDLLWENGIVPYVIDETFDPTAKNVILEAFRHFHERTCVRFVHHTDENDYLIFQTLEGCWSSIGRDGGPQILSLDDDCETLGIVIHEIMHALGFEHEHSRRDRDKYVTIHWENIGDEDEYNFDTYDHKLGPLGAPYDYNSLLHYFATAFSSNDKPTIVPKNGDVYLLVDRNYFSKWDLFKINKVYNCGMTGLEEKLLPGDGECYIDTMARDYRGEVSKTKDGKTCQNWFSLSPHQHPYTGQQNDELRLANLGLGNHNWCRNPDDDSEGAWCFTTDPDVRYGYCDIGSTEENCAAESSECYQKPDGSDYRGMVSITEDGEPCIRWADSGWTLGHEYGGSGHNYCRNPDDDSTAWCNTESGFGYCDIGHANYNCANQYISFL